MRVAVTARGPDPTEELDERFGRAYWILILDTVENTWEALDNGACRNRRENAGIRCAEGLLEKKVHVLLTGEIGPKALRILREGGVQVFTGGEGSVRNVVAGWRCRRLKEAEGANCTWNPDCLMGKFNSRTREWKAHSGMEKPY